MDKTYLICKPVSEGEPPLPSALSFCGSCGQAIWISNQEYRPGLPNCELVCTDCGLQQMITSDNELDITIPQAQRDALKTLGFSDKDADTIIKRIRGMIECGRQLRDLHE